MNHSEITEEEIVRYWDDNADSWTEQVRKGQDAYREFFNNPAFFKFIGNLGGKIVLDIGCGEGYNTRILARKGARIVGVDISGKMVKLARQMEQKEPLGIRYEVASFSNLSLFDDASFDVVVSSMALMDGPDYEGVIREIFGVLRKRGKLFFSINHPCFYTKGFGWIKDNNGNPIKITASHYFDHESKIERWRFKEVSNDIKPFAVPHFHRLLSDYLNALIGAGFTLKRIEEPRPTQQICKKHPWLRKWRDHAAMFLYVHAVKQ